MKKTYNNGKSLMPSDVKVYKNGKYYQAFLGFLPIKIKYYDKGRKVKVRGKGKPKFYVGTFDNKKTAKKDFLEFLSHELLELAKDC